MSEELKQCPFCASNDWLIGFEERGRDRHREYCVSCLNCGAIGPSDLGRSGAIEMWNLRRDKLPPETLYSTLPF